LVKGKKGRGKKTSADTSERSDKDRKTKEPAPQATAAVFEETKKRGVLIGKGGVWGNVIRTGLMLNATKEEADLLVDAIDAGLTVASKM